LLENQQQLAVAVSADRKKDAMIEQLDKVCNINSLLGIKLKAIALRECFLKLLLCLEEGGGDV